MLQYVAKVTRLLSNLNFYFREDLRSLVELYRAQMWVVQIITSMVACALKLYLGSVDSFSFQCSSTQLKLPVFVSNLDFTSGKI